MSYWQELFHNDKLSPPEYKYLFPDLNNVANEAVKELLTSKLTEGKSTPHEKTLFWIGRSIKHSGSSMKLSMA